VKASRPAASCFERSAKNRIICHVLGKLYRPDHLEIGESQIAHPSGSCIRGNCFLWSYFRQTQGIDVCQCLASHVSLEVNSATSESCSAAPGFSRPDLLEEILAMLHDRHYDHVVIQQTKEYVLSTVGIMGCTIFSLPFNWNSNINS